MFKDFTAKTTLLIQDPFYFVGGESIASLRMDKLVISHVWQCINKIQQYTIHLLDKKCLCFFLHSFSNYIATMGYNWNYKNGDMIIIDVSLFTIDVYQIGDNRLEFNIRFQK